MKKKSFTVKKAYALCFLGLMAILGVAPILLFVQNHLQADDGTNAKPAAVSLAKQYPFAEDADASPSSEQAEFGLVDEYLAAVHRITRSTELYLTEHTPFAGPLGNLNLLATGGLLAFSQGSIVLNGSNAFVKLPNGYLAGCFVYCPSRQSWANILDFSTWLQERDIPFMSLVTPDKSDDSITVFPEGVPHGYTQTIDEYKAFMEQHDIAYIEAKQVLLAQNGDFYSWFYKTDHHWNVHAAYAMARETARVLNDEYHVSADASALDDGKFALEVYPDSFLGSYGLKLGDAWIEDMEVYYPTADTSFHVEMFKKGTDETGSFEEVLIDQSFLGTASKYSAFMSGDQSLIRIENNLCKNGTRVLVIKHSAADALCPYLACTVQYLDMIDPRYFDGSIRSFVEQTDPDMVVLCMDVPIESYEDHMQLK